MLYYTQNAFLFQDPKAISPAQEASGYVSSAVQTLTTATRPHVETALQVRQARRTSTQWWPAGIGLLGFSAQNV